MLTPQAGTFFAQLHISCVMVQDGQLESLVRKKKGLVLGMDVNKTCGNILKYGNRHRTVVHESP